MTWFVIGSIRLTVPSYSLLAQMAPCVATSACGPSPTAIVAVALGCPDPGSMRVTLNADWLATHIAPSASREPEAPAAAGTELDNGAPVLASGCETVPAAP